MMNFNDLLRLQAVAAAAEAVNTSTNSLSVGQQAVQEASEEPSLAGSHSNAGTSGSNKKRKIGTEGKLLLPSADLDHLPSAPTHATAPSSSSNAKNDSSKKRYVWPESLHRDFIGAVFDVGLKVASLNEIQTVLADHPAAVSNKVNVTQDKGFEAQFLKLRLFRDINLFPRQTYFEQEQGMPFNPSQQGEGQGFATSGGAVEEGEHSEAEEGALDPLSELQAAAFDAKTALAYDTTIAAITQHLTHLMASIEYEENLLRNLQASLPRHYVAYQSLLHRLQDIDALVAKPFLDRPPPSFLSCLATQSSDDDVGSVKSTPHDHADRPKRARSSSSSNDLDYSHRGHGHSKPAPSSDDPDFYQHSHHGSQHQTGGSHLHTYTHTHDDSTHTHTHEHSHEHSHSHFHEHRNNSLDDLLQPLSSSRTELNIMYEMRAQMDLHRKLLEKKETQLQQHGGRSTAGNSNNQSAASLVQALSSGADANLQGHTANSSTGSIPALDPHNGSGPGSQTNSLPGSTNAPHNPVHGGHPQDWDSETFELTDLFSFLHEP